MNGFDRRTVLRGALAAMAATTIPRAFAKPGLPVKPNSLEKLSLRLEWLPQAEFAGYILARELGYFRDRGLDVDIRPGGPGRPAFDKVAKGEDDVGIGPVTRVFTSRIKGTPFKIIALPVQDSIFRFVLKGVNRIVSLRQIRGRKIGLWLGGDETEFVAIANKQNMRLDDFEVIPQDDKITGFIEDKYVLSEVTVINELIDIRKAGYPDSGLQIISPADYGVAMPSDCLFTTDKMLATRRPALLKFLDAARQGWRAAFADKDAAVRTLVALYPKLDAGHQMAQLQAMEPLIHGPDGRVPFGQMDSVVFERIQETLADIELLPGPLFLGDILDSSLIESL